MPPVSLAVLQRLLLHVHPELCVTQNFRCPPRRGCHVPSLAWCGLHLRCTHVPQPARRATGAVPLPSIAAFDLFGSDAPKLRATKGTTLTPRAGPTPSHRAALAAACSVRRADEHETPRGGGCAATCRLSHRANGSPHPSTEAPDQASSKPP